MSILHAALHKLPEYQRLLAALGERRRAVSLSGVGEVMRAHFVSGLVADLGRPVLVIARDDQAGRDFAGMLAGFDIARVSHLPARDFVFHNIEGASREYEQQRIAALHLFAGGESPVMVSSPAALMMRTLPAGILARACLTLKLGERHDLKRLVDRLVYAGYLRAEAVEGPGQFALRGGILDIFPPGQEHPVRAEFFDDEIDSMGLFDKESQRRFENVKQVTVLPVREVLPDAAEGGAHGLADRLDLLAHKSRGALKKSLSMDAAHLRDLGLLAAGDRYFDQIYGAFATAFDHLPDDVIVVVSDTPAVMEGAKGFEWRMGEDTVELMESGVLPGGQGFAMGHAQFAAALAARKTLYADSFMHGHIAFDEIISLTGKQLYGYGASLELAVSDMKDYLLHGFSVYVLAGGRARANSLISLLNDRGVPCVISEAQAGPGRVCVLPRTLMQGFEYPLSKIAVLSEGGGQQARQKRARTPGKNRVRSFTDLVPGDLVVHEHHGIGRFAGVERISVDGAWRDYIKIAYLGSDSVFVPSTSLNLVSKYIGGSGDGEGVKLSKLGGSSWAKAKQRAKHAAKDLAEELIRLYSQRKNTPGIAFLPDDDMQQAFEEAFAFDETDDQLETAREIKEDMQKPFPMDRLLCGDVGFGKTEVAFRAVMKCVLGGRQAALLVPTTVLARQHYLTALSRFSGYPIEIAVMSRFTTPKEAAKTLRRLALGQIDLLIGTHRILQKDIILKRPGLLVIDEEQRFGVAHKERIKQMSVGVDVLTLSATPIPRTLNMALAGIRDMSLLEEAPLGRYPVQTYVLEHDETVVRDAIRRELARGGKVYYLFNRIDGIERCASNLRAHFPDAAVEVAHGRMGEEELSGVMLRTYEGKVDILVCTTIIETGIDIPDVNTLVIEDADRFGLAQLHQIRGRVGRGTRRASAYLTYRRGKVLSEIAQKRLTAIREFAEFGSGFKIAMRDLEIRGAGNILGAEQSGHMANVGYEMYLRLLEEATGEITGETRLSPVECLIDIPVSAGLPETYVESAGARIDLYRRIAQIHDQSDLFDMVDELQDRFGDLSKPVRNLLDIALLRAAASGGGVSEISLKEGKLLFFFDPKDIARAMMLCGLSESRGRMLLSAGDRPYISLRLTKSDELLAAASGTIKRYRELKEERA